MAREAIELYLDTIVEEGRTVPTPSDIETLRNQPEFADAIWAIVAADYNRKSAA